MTFCSPFCTSSFSENGIYTKRKEFAPQAYSFLSELMRIDEEDKNIFGKVAPLASTVKFRY